MSDSQKAIRKSIAAIAPQLEKLASNLHAAPELGFEETKACKWQIDILKKWGFKVQSPFAKLPTADEAKGLGTGKTSFGVDLNLSKTLNYCADLHATDV